MREPKHVAPDIDTKQRSARLWLLVFDLDGTLIDSSVDLCSSVNAALAYVGKSTLAHEQITSFIGDGAATLMKRALSASSNCESLARSQDQIFSAAFAYFLAFYRRHKLDTTCLYPGVTESLTAIRASHPHLLMAVLTNKPQNPSREICSALGLAPFFFANYGGDSFPTKKPAPEGLLALMQEARTLLMQRQSKTTSFAASGVVMIGDSPADVLVARACGARSLGCLYGLAPEELLQAKPDRLVRAASAWSEALDL